MLAPSARTSTWRALASGSGRLQGLRRTRRCRELTRHHHHHHRPRRPCRLRRLRRQRTRQHGRRPRPRPRPHPRPRPRPRPRPSNRRAAAHTSSGRWTLHRPRARWRDPVAPSSSSRCHMPGDRRSRARCLYVVPQRRCTGLRPVPRPVPPPFEATHTSSGAAEGTGELHVRRHRPGANVTAVLRHW